MNDQKITRLSGPDRIRKRPAVIFGADDIEGVQAAVRYLLEIFATEAQLGHCSALSVVQQGSVLEISGNDRGLYLGQDTGDDRVWQELFCDMYPAPACPTEENGWVLELFAPSHHTLYGDAPPADTLFLPEDAGCFELYCTQCASRYMEVSVNRRGIHSQLQFHRGHCTDGIRHTPTTAPDGTCFRFEPDAEVFRQTHIPAGYFTELLESLAILCPGLQCSFTDSAGQQTVFHYPRGISDYASRHSAVPVYRQTIRATGKERYNRAAYDACADFALGYAPDCGSTLCFHNFRKLTQGGTHYRQLQKQLCRSFAECFAADLPADAAPLTFEELSRHLSVVLVSWCAPRCTRWETGARRAICNQLIADMTYDTAGNTLRDYLHANKKSYRPLVAAILAHRAQRNS